MSWTIESDIKLINLVKKYDMFYNPKSSDYRNVTLKSDVWKRIGSILDKTDEDCCRRWGYVRGHYVRRRGKPAPKRCSDVVKNGLKRAKLLTFLDEYRGDYYNNDSSTDQSVTEPPSSEVSYENYDDLDDDEDDIVEVKPEKHDIVDLEDDSYYKETEERENAEPKASTETPNKDTNLESFDETDHFFASMAKIAKKLPRRDQVMLRMQIATMVGNAELKQMENERK
ncbi:uncharacterized protein LOC133527568 [Cydia pomonella]|uniref:uncharacterized protein LOC133527568 n=1 Tax=Cydia pomonella TaxID=82600 RepID=UPI002ADD845E|nr:uncharacterized protein LOC133527568 [Cydia pomonella]